MQHEAMKPKRKEKKNNEQAQMPRRIVDVPSVASDRCQVACAISNLLSAF
jgi:hypothetical protein